MKHALVILCGIPFSGKSTLAKKLETNLGFTRIDLDDIKFELLGSSVKDEDIPQSDWDRVYQNMYQRIREKLGKKQGVIHDTGNFTVYERNFVNRIAKELKVPFVTIYVDVPTQIARTRMTENRANQERFNVSDEAFESAIKEMEPPTTEEHPIIFNEKQGYENFVQSIKNRLSFS